MQESSEALFEAAMKLPEAERLRLASRLLETKADEDAAIGLEDPAFQDELERRFTDPADSVAWPDLRDERR